MEAMGRLRNLGMMIDQYRQNQTQPAIGVSGNDPIFPTEPNAARFNGPQGAMGSGRGNVPVDTPPSSNGVPDQFKTAGFQPGSELVNGLVGKKPAVPPSPTPAPVQSKKPIGTGQPMANPTPNTEKKQKRMGEG